MAKQKLKGLENLNRLVYSTDPHQPLEPEPEESITLTPSQQALRIWLETKHRGGKAASVVRGFVGSNDALEQLGKHLKQYCGTGGAVKDGEIIIQGDHRDKILAWLQKEGYSLAKKAGG